MGLEPRINTSRANAHHQPEDVAAALELSLQNLGVEYGKYLVVCFTDIPNIYSGLIPHA